MASNAIKNDLNTHLKVWKEIHKDNSISGEHDGNLHNLEEVVMHNVVRKGFSIFRCSFL